jgi:hypothetical protein
MNEDEIVEGNEDNPAGAHYCIMCGIYPTPTNQLWCEESTPEKIEERS